jgi:hypothetical protein
MHKAYGVISGVMCNLLETIDALFYKNGSRCIQKPNPLDETHLIIAESFHTLCSQWFLIVFLSFNGFMVEAS